MILSLLFGLPRITLDLGDLHLRPPSDRYLFHLYLVVALGSCPDILRIRLRDLPFGRFLKLDWFRRQPPIFPCRVLCSFSRIHRLYRRLVEVSVLDLPRFAL